MPFAKRDADGRICALLAEDPGDGGQRLEATNLDVLQFVFGEREGKFLAADLELVRVIEDVVIALINREVLSPYDLPAAAIEKLRKRNVIRREVLGAASLSPSEEDDPMVAILRKWM